MKNAWRRLAAMHLFFAVALSGCVQRVQETKEDSINVLAVLPLSGAYEANGVRHRKALQMAVDQLESSGTLLPGRRLRLVPVSSGETILQAKRNVAKALEELTDASGRVNVAAMISSAAQEGSLAAAIERRIPHFEVAVGSDPIEFIYGDMSAPDLSYAFSSRPLCAPEAAVTADFMISRGWDSVCLVRGPEVHDQIHTVVIRERLAEKNKQGMVVNASDIVMPIDGPYEPAIRECLSLTPRPKAIFWHLGGDVRNIEFMRASQRVDEEIDPTRSFQLLTCGMARKESLLDPVSPGVVRYLDGNFWFVMRSPIPGDALTRVRADFEAFAGEKPDTFTSSAYDAMMLVGLAIAQAQSTDGTAVRDNIRTVSKDGTKFGYGQHAEALAAIRAGQNVDWDGAGTPFDYDQDNSVLGRFYVEEVRFNAAANRGEYVVLADPAPEFLTGGVKQWSNDTFQPPGLVRGALTARPHDGPCPCAGGE
jgi:branched-chain amino acid transport system substrate-binding protein